MSLFSVFALIAKDARCELRTRQAIGSVLLFAVTSTVAVSFALGLLGENSRIAAALLWIVIYFSAMAGLGRSFTHEEETGTAGLLKLAVTAENVYLGKLLFNFVTLICVELVTVPLFVVLTGCQVRCVGMFIALVVLGSLALSSGATAAAAMVSRAAGKGALLAAISFPLLAPALGLAIAGTDVAMQGTSSAASDLRLLIYYCGIVTIGSLMLFRFVWEE